MAVVRRKASRRSGMTAVEIAVSVVLAGLVFGSVGLVSQTSERAYRTSITGLQLEGRLRRATSRVIDVLATSSVGTYLPDPTGDDGASNVQFRQVVGIAGANVQLGAFQRLLFERDPAEEQDNGVDDDGDGLVDEGNLVLVIGDGAAGERRVTLARDVLELLEGETANGLDDNGNGATDEPGFFMRREGAALSLWLSMGAVDPDGNTVVRSLDTTIRLRNGV